MTTDRLAEQLAALGSNDKPMPTEQARPARWEARMSLTLSPAAKRALDLATVDDGIERTARVRAMIQLWQTDPRLRARVDKLARQML